MSEGMPPVSSTEPAPGTAPANEPWDVKVKQLIAPFMPPADPSQDTPEAKMLRAIYILIAVALLVIIVFGGLYMLVSLFR
jgi:hypothetical protein